MPPPDDSPDESVANPTRPGSDPTGTTAGTGDREDWRLYLGLPPGTPPPFDIVVGDYRITREPLGYGTFGYVFPAECRDGSRVVIKILRVHSTDFLPEPAGGLPGWRERFEREIRLMGLRLPVAPRWHADGEFLGARWYVMEMLVGETLLDWRARGAPAPATVLRLAVELVSHLGTLHGLDDPILHRDIAANNVFVEAHCDRCRLLDLGNARRKSVPADDVTLPGERVLPGNRATMDPAFLRTGTLDESSDVYSLGCVLFYLWAGRYPYATVFEAARGVPARWPEPGTVPELGTAFESLLRRMIAVDPARRPASAREVLARLHRIAAELCELADTRADLPAAERRAALAALGVDPATDTLRADAAVLAYQIEAGQLCRRFLELYRTRLDTWRVEVLPNHEEGNSARKPFDDMHRLLLGAITPLRQALAAVPFIAGLLARVEAQRDKLARDVRAVLRSRRPLSVGEMTVLVKVAESVATGLDGELAALDGWLGTRTDALRRGCG